MQPEYQSDQLTDASPSECFEVQCRRSRQTHQTASDHPMMEFVQDHTHEHLPLIVDQHARIAGENRWLALDHMVSP